MVKTVRVNVELIEAFELGMNEMVNLEDRLDEITISYLEDLDKRKKEEGFNYIRKDRIVREVADNVLSNLLRIRRYLEGTYYSYETLYITGMSSSIIKKLVNEGEYIDVWDKEEVNKELLNRLDEDIIERVISIGMVMSDFKGRVDSKYENEGLMIEMEG